MSKELLRQLKELKQINDQLTPDRIWVDKNRAALMTKVTADQDAAKQTVVNDGASDRWSVISYLSIFVPKSFAYMRPAFMVFVTLGVLTSGWIATASAKLGDTFYPVKIAAEKTQVALISVVGDEGTKARLHLDLASKRAEEVKESVRLKSTASPDDQKKLVDAEKKAINSLQASLEKSKEIVRTVSETDPMMAADLLKETHVQTEAIVGSLREVATSAKETTPELSENIAKTTQEVREAKLETIQTVLEKNTDNEAVKSIAVEAIDAAMRDVASSTLPIGNIVPVLPITTSTGVQLDASSTISVVPPTTVTTIPTSSSIGRVLQQDGTTQPVTTPELIQALGEARALTTSAPVPVVAPVSVPTVPEVKSEMTTSSEKAKS